MALQESLYSRHFLYKPSTSFNENEKAFLLGTFGDNISLHWAPIEMTLTHLPSPNISYNAPNTTIALHEKLYTVLVQNLVLGEKYYYKYKYGEVWEIDHNQPSEHSSEGYLNNVLVCSSETCEKMLVPDNICPETESVPHKQTVLQTIDLPAKTPFNSQQTQDLQSKDTNTETISLNSNIKQNSNNSSLDTSRLLKEDPSSQTEPTIYSAREDQRSTLHLLNNNNDSLSTQNTSLNQNQDIQDTSFETSKTGEHKDSAFGSLEYDLNSYLADKNIDTPEPYNPHTDNNLIFSNTDYPTSISNQNKLEFKVDPQAENNDYDFSTHSNNDSIAENDLTLTDKSMKNDKAQNIKSALALKLCNYDHESTPLLKNELLDKTQQKVTPKTPSNTDADSETFKKSIISSDKDNQTNPDIILQKTHDMDAEPVPISSKFYSAPKFTIDTTKSNSLVVAQEYENKYPIPASPTVSTTNLFATFSSFPNDINSSANNRVEIPILNKAIISEDLNDAKTDSKSITTQINSLDLSSSARSSKVSKPRPYSDALINLNRILVSTNKSLETESGSFKSNSLSIPSDSETPNRSENITSQPTNTTLPVETKQLDSLESIENRKIDNEESSKASSLHKDKASSSSRNSDIIDPISKKKALSKSPTKMKTRFTKIKNGLTLKKSSDDASALTSKTDVSVESSSNNASDSSKNGAIASLSVNSSSKPSKSSPKKSKGFGSIFKKIF
ncbi:hypothetical protein BB561_003347 [Smittium simulii]|uniref:Uncharacterized protein n=1 Tax=Smittium simulii TaxID=133385 RepID=A0A2T9YM15_9FUNG|nr:hypothetical protein BB561_003347 [Smittium simulii]